MTDYSQKRDAAIAYLGPKWVLHPSRRVVKLKEAQQSDIHKADVGATFKRVLKQMEAAK